jgi:signal transduction histidine kinase
MAVKSGGRVGASRIRAVWDDLAFNAGDPFQPMTVSRFPLAYRLPHLLVVACAALLAGSSWHILLTDYDVPNEQAAALGISHALTLVVCLSRPMLAWWLSLAMVVVTALVTASTRPEDGPLWAGPSLATHLAVLALVGLRVRPRVLVEMWLLTVVAAVALAVAMPGRDQFPNLPETAVLSGAVLIAAGALRGRGEALRRLAQQERLSEQERARHALLEERTRIARELHDVVAHHMSVVAIQAEAAPYRVPDPPEEITRSFATIRGSALEALTELHRILGLLRNQAVLGEPAPQPTLDGLDALIAGVRETGLTVDLEITGHPRDLPPGVDLSAYRIVQESLSNVLRHAPGAHVHVQIARLPERLEIHVRNGPARQPPAGTRRAGHGLLGMRERVTMLGGELTAGPRSDGGFVVSAVLPLPTADRGGDRP